MQNTPFLLFVSSPPCPEHLRHADPVPGTQRDELTVALLEELPAQQRRHASKEVITGQSAQGLQGPLTQVRVGGAKSGKASYEW